MCSVREILCGLNALTQPVAKQDENTKLIEKDKAEPTQSFKKRIYAYGSPFAVYPATVVEPFVVQMDDLPADKKDKQSGKLSPKTR